MGFGLLFIGYFFLINITYYAYTDIIAAMVMLMAFYKLSPVCRPFKHAAVADGAFAALALAELVLSALSLFDVYTANDVVSASVSVVRYVLIFLISAFMLMGIRDVAKEVGADALAKSAGTSAPLTAVYLIAALLNLPIDNILGAATPYVFVIVIFAVIAYHVTNLVTVYKAYAGICMPEDNRKREKKKRGFTDKLFDRIEERSREYQEYKLGRAKDDKNKKRRK